MVTNNFFDHVGSNGSTLGSRVAATGYAASALGENIAAGYGTVTNVMTGWMNSPALRQHHEPGLHADRRGRIKGHVDKPLRRLLDHGSGSAAVRRARQSIACAITLPPRHTSPS